tara:strand:+ start:1376 stop:1633 length:258 start_codon:yes stop_codon:yes gene_type:complete
MLQLSKGVYMNNTESLTKLREQLAEKDPALAGKIEEVFKKAQLYETIRNDSCDEDITRLADDGSFYLLKGEALDRALAEYLRQNH